MGKAGRQSEDSEAVGWTRGDDPGEETGGVVSIGGEDDVGNLTGASELGQLEELAREVVAVGHDGVKVDVVQRLEVPGSDLEARVEVEDVDGRLGAVGVHFLHRHGGLSWSQIWLL